MSVIIPTYNRTDLLGDAIDSFRSQTYPRDRFEIIVADNNSRDDTRTTIECRAAEDPRVRYLLETRQGVHYARNRAAKIARGDILYFTDDDMVADSRVLEELVAVLTEHETVAMATGKVVAQFDTEPPAWVRKYLKNYLLSVTEEGTPDCIVVSDRDPGVYSCHEAVRREVFFKVGGFHPENTAGVWLGDGETGMNLAIAAMGWKFAYTPSAVIRHRIPNERTTLKYLVRRFSNQGFCDSYAAYRRHRTRSGVVRDLLLRNPGGALKLFLFTLVQIARRRRSWHFLLGHLAYVHHRSLFDVRLLRDAEFRRLVEIDDWLSE